MKVYCLFVANNVILRDGYQLQLDQFRGNLFQTRKHVSIQGLVPCNCRSPYNLQNQSKSARPDIKACHGMSLRQTLSIFGDSIRNPVFGIFYWIVWLRPICFRFINAINFADETSFNVVESHFRVIFENYFVFFQCLFSLVEVTGSFQRILTL